MIDFSNSEVDDSFERKQPTLQRGFRAVAAHYDRAADRIVVELLHGCTFSFPPRIAQGLATASEDQLSEVEILGIGFGLHWKSLDVDLSVTGLMSGLFGTQTYMQTQFTQSNAM